MNDNGLHHLLWLSVSLEGHASLGDGEVRRGDGDGVTAEIIVLGGGRVHCSHCLALVGEQRTQHHNQMRRTDSSCHQQLPATEHCQHLQLQSLRCSPTVHLYTPSCAAMLSAHSFPVDFHTFYFSIARCKINLFLLRWRCD